VAVVNLTLGGFRCTDVRLTIPAWGLPYADVAVDGEQAIAVGSQTSLVLADLTMSTVTVMSGGPAVGRSFYKVVAGAGGWGSTLKKKSYANDAGVKLATVLRDAASDAGESIDLTTVDPTATVGTYFVRRADLACRLLEQLSPGAWYVGTDGVTRLGSRAASTIATTVPVTSQVDLARQRVTVSSESLAQFVPGLSFQGLSVVDVEHNVSAKGGLHSTLWGMIGTGESQRMAAWRALFNQLDPNRAYRGIYEYRVVSQSGERLDLQVVRVSTGLPDVQAVLPRPGVAGCKVQPALGSRVLVAFVNADPTNPVVTGFENAEASGYLPLNLTADATGTVAVGPSASGVALAGGGAAIGRVGDEITISSTQWTAAAPTAPSGGGLVTISAPLKGMITAGSPKSTSG
jgi:hypothetical protein